MQFLNAVDNVECVQERTTLLHNAPLFFTLKIRDNNNMLSPTVRGEEKKINQGRVIENDEKVG